MAQIQTLDQSLPTEIDIQVADTLRKLIASQLEKGGESGPTFSYVKDDGQPAEVVLTPQLANKFLAILRLISSGKGFYVVPINAELTTQQAADMLNVSRPFFIGLLDNGSIPYHLVGRHRRVRAEELFRYMEMRSIERDAAMKELIQSDFEDGLI